MPIDLNATSAHPPEEPFYLSLGTIGSLISSAGQHIGGVMIKKDYPFMVIIKNDKVNIVHPNGVVQTISIAGFISEL